ncbi:MAG: APC family permease [Actinomycetota bacterium]
MIPPGIPRASTRDADGRPLHRMLGLQDAVVIGAGSMIGAGVYAVWSQAAEAAGSQLLLGLLVAGLVAYCNAVASGRLAALHPESGGTYVYGYERLGPMRGFVAGWGFVIGKTASCAAMALTAGAYLWPENDRMIAVIAIVVITGVNLGGLERTVMVTRVLLAITGSVLVVVLLSGWVAGDIDTSRLDVGSRESFLDSTYGILQSAGLLFFAFAGYARIATLGEEVRDPERVIPRAILVALAAVLVLYSVIAVTVVTTLAPDDLAASSDPLRLVVESGSWRDLAPIVRIGAGIASLGALLNLIPGVARTALAMARRRDLPRALARLTPGRPKPVRAELTVATAAVVVILAFDLRSAIGISGVGVLTYYAITNWSALTLPSTVRQRALGVIGLIGCSVLVMCLPGWAVLTGIAVMLTGCAGRLATRGFVRRTP